MMRNRKMRKRTPSPAIRLREVALPVLPLLQLFAMLQLVTDEVTVRQVCVWSVVVRQSGKRRRRPPDHEIGVAARNLHQRRGHPAATPQWSGRSDLRETARRHPEPRSPLGAVQAMMVPICCEGSFRAIGLRR